MKLNKSNIKARWKHEVWCQYEECDPGDYSMDYEGPDEEETANNFIADSYHDYYSIEEAVNDFFKQNRTDKDTMYGVNELNYFKEDDKLSWHCPARLTVNHEWLKKDKTGALVPLEEGDMKAYYRGDLKVYYNVVTLELKYANGRNPVFANFDAIKYFEKTLEEERKSQKQ